MTTSSERRGTVLVIEDDPDYSEFLSEVLRDSGFQAEVVTDGAEAFERAQTLKPSAITLDILLPGRTGIALYRQFQSNAALRDIPIIIVTGVGAEGKKLQVDRFFAGRSAPSPEHVLQKPVEPEELTRVVGDAIRRRAV
jgi:two-component system, OmpR family, phosphate regulon response regulator PhoB